MLLAAGSCSHASQGPKGIAERVSQPKSVGLRWGKTDPCAANFVGWLGQARQLKALVCFGSQNWRTSQFWRGRRSIHPRHEDG